MCEQGKIPRELPLVKRANTFTQAQLNRNQDLVVPVLDSSRATFFFFSIPSTSQRRDNETYLQDRLKEWISFSYALIGCSNSGYPVQFTSERRQTRVSYEQNGLPVCCRNKRRSLTKKLKKLFPKKHEEGDELWFGTLYRWSFVCLTKIDRWNRWKGFLFTNVFCFCFCFCFFFDGSITCMASPQAFSVIAFGEVSETNGQETRSDHVTRNASAARNNET